MRKVLLKFKDAVIKEILLEKEVYTIGRKEDNDVVIDNLATSGHHAKLIREGETMYVEDQNSTNGTFINGKRIVKSALNNGDVILVGNHTLEFITDVKPAADQTKTGVRARSMDETVLLSPTDQEKILVTAEKLEVVGGFVVIEGTTNKKEYELKERVSTIGKDDSAVIKLKGLFAPKVAALINRRKDGYFITPSGGKEIKINGNKVEQRYDLKDGDIVEVAGLKMQFYIKE
jgi:pSer/pThr/pTyr-binding forkhead associated (FHA) protein